ncbi:MAG: RluA family pseudouridine synthase [Spirochaetaceae bacterium]|jgi:tRNA pseudouridine32 synthase/23S rRNA pseudouridine746 synthase|nr:RluA family pseudouridine synthase [Spirochaetaceae bacterium]
MVPLLYEDNDFLIVEKAAGLLSVPGRGPEKQDCLIRRVQRTFPRALIVHRLDQPTSGVIALALNRNSHRYLSGLFERRMVIKEYEALVWGQPPMDEGEIDLPIRADIMRRPIQVVDSLNGKRSITGWKVMEYLDGYTRVKLFPHTGRTHQLRLHMMTLGCPILGDQLYSSQEQAKKHDRLMLHASYLSFTAHEERQDRVGVFSPVPF